MCKGTIPHKWSHCQPKITNFKFWPPCNQNRPLFLECVVHIVTLFVVCRLTIMHLCWVCGLIVPAGERVKCKICIKIDMPDTFLRYSLNGWGIRFPKSKKVFDHGVRKWDHLSKIIQLFGAPTDLWWDQFTF